MQTKTCDDSGVPAAKRAARWSTITIGTEPHANKEKENHATIFSCSLMASGMD